MDIHEARAKSAQLWTKDGLDSTVMDPELAEAFAQLLAEETKEPETVDIHELKEGDEILLLNRYIVNYENTIGLVIYDKEFALDIQIDQDILDKGKARKVE